MKFFSNTRHLVLGLVDGGVSGLSVLTTSFFIGNFDGVEVFKICSSVAIANLASNFGGGYLAEEAEHGKHQMRIEMAMGVKRGYLNRTAFKERLERKTFARASVYGFASVIGILIAALPLLFLPMPLGFYAAFATSLALFLLVGFLIGKITKQNVLFTIGKVVIISAIVFFLNFVVGAA